MTEANETIRRNQIIIVDIEATCWEGDPPAGEQNEIIEIGISVFDLATQTPAPPVSILVKPTRSTISPFCTQLTSLTQDLVDTGVTFYEACARLQSEFATKNHLWGSWGSYDLKMFKAQCHEFDVEYPFSKRHVNLKKLFADAVNGKTRLGMADALIKAGLTLQGTHHRGGDDAYNIARLLGVALTTGGDAILERYW
jgi:inhibitor of KinA sporulation pathway (predicted exonuclease)